MPLSGPTVVRRQLGRRLRRLREQAGVTVEQVEAARFGSRAKLWRIENGQVRVTVPDVWALCRIYQVGEADTVTLTTLARRTTEHGWWHAYRELVPEWFRLYLGLETTASRLCTWEDAVVPGELQTPAYAYALWRDAWPEVAETAIGPHVALRRERQDGLLARTPPPRLTVVLGENVIRRQVGGPEVLTAQIEHLVALAERETVDIRILPFTAGAHPATTGAFRILQFDAADDPDVVYVELELEARYLERPAEVDRYRRMFTRLQERAVRIGDYER